MKILAAGFLVLTLSGCAAVQKVTDLWPRDHDPVMASTLVTLERSLSSASCSDRETINEPASISSWLSDYSNFRNDPQKKAVKDISENLVKAASSSEAACQRWMNIVSIKMKIVKDSWSKR